jgi:hypothetical protein
MILAVVALVAAIGVGSGVAVAAGDPPKQPSQQQQQQSFTDALAAKLGVTPERLREAIRSVIAERIDAGVAAGRLDADLAARLKDWFQHADRPAFGSSKPGWGPKFHWATGWWLRFAADAVGIEPDELRAELKSGKSLPEILKGHGLTADSVKKSILDATKAKLDRAVAEDRLSADSAERVLDRLTTWVDRVVDRIFAAPAATP